MSIFTGIQIGPRQLELPLQANPRLTVQEIITALDKEFGWKSTGEQPHGPSVYQSRQVYAYRG